MSPKRPPKSTFVSEKPLQEQIGYFTILMEDVRDQVKLLAEGQGVLDNKVGSLDNRMNSLDGRMNSLDDRMGLLGSRMDSLDSRMGSLDSRVGSLDSRVGSLEQRVETYHHELKGEIQFTQMALKATKDELNKKIEGVEKNLSTKIDSVVEIVKRHDQEISFLKLAVGK